MAKKKTKIFSSVTDAQYGAKNSWLINHCPNRTCDVCKFWNEESGCTHSTYPGELYTRETFVCANS